MSEPIKTEWFPHSVNPVHHGVYLVRKSSGAQFWRAFDGANWHYGLIAREHDKDLKAIRSPSYEACMSQDCVSHWVMQMGFEWCGLVEESK